jgi:hypothetical protein
LSFDLVVVVVAEETEIVNIGRTALSPWDDVMAFGPLRGSFTGRESASLVSGDQRARLVCRRDPLGLAVAQDLPVVVAHDPAKERFIRKAQGVGHGDGVAESGSGDSPASLILVRRHGDEDAGWQAAGHRKLARAKELLQSGPKRIMQPLVWPAPIALGLTDEEG